MTSTVNDMIRARAALDPFGRPSAAELQAYITAKTALNAEAKANWGNDTWHREVAALVAERLDFGFQFDNLFGTYFETRTVGEFETIEIRERRGLKVFWTSRGGYIEESQLKTERFELPRDTIGFHVSEHSDKLRQGFAETIEALVSLAEMKLDAEINRRMFNMLQAAVPNTSPYYVNATGGLTKAILDTGLREVRDAIRPDNGVVAPVTIIGRAAMVDKISTVVTDPAALYDPGATAEIRAQGRLGVYRGANIVSLKNYTDDNAASIIPANELWIFGGTVGLFAFYGGTQTKSWEENTVDYRHYRGRRDVGGLIYHPEYARRIIDGTVTP